MTRWIARFAGSAMVALALVGCGSSTSPSVHVDGSTPAWFQGRVVELDYNHVYQCTNPPPAQSTSKCEVGVAAETVPSGAVPIYVMVPLFSPAPAASTLQCPMTGSCVDHPTDLDLSTNLSAVFGPSAGQTPLPPHSHIVDDLAGNAYIPWNVIVVGVLDAPTWAAIASGQSLATVASLQASDPTLGSSGTGVGTHITTNIPSNLILFFRAH